MVGNSLGLYGRLFKDCVPRTDVITPPTELLSVGQAEAAKWVGLCYVSQWLFPPRGPNVEVDNSPGKGRECVRREYRVRVDEIRERRRVRVARRVRFHARVRFASRKGRQEVFNGPKIGSFLFTFPATGRGGFRHEVDDGVDGGLFLRFWQVGLTLVLNGEDGASPFLFSFQSYRQFGLYRVALSFSVGEEGIRWGQRSRLFWRVDVAAREAFLILRRFVATTGRFLFSNSPFAGRDGQCVNGTGPRARVFQAGCIVGIHRMVRVRSFRFQVGTIRSP